MKRWIVWIFIAAVMLSGCAQTQVDNTTGPTNQTDTSHQQNELPQGLYVPESTTELQTHGAVRIYPIDGRCTGIAVMGENILMAASGDDLVTTLSLLSGLTCVPKYSVKLDCEIYMDSSVSVTDKAVGYYHGASNSIVLLNEKLEETDRISMPDNMTGAPVLCSDLSEAYYCTGTDIRGLNLKTEISRLIRESRNRQQTLVRSVFQDTVLECFVDTGTECYTEFLSTQTGESLGKDASFIQITAQADAYYLERMEGSVRERLFGTQDGSAYSFLPESEMADILALPSWNAVVSAENAENAENGTMLNLYDLHTGKRTASVMLEQVSAPVFVLTDPAQEAVWFVCYNDKLQQDVLYRWEPALSAVEDTQVYTDTRYTRKNPDTEMLQQLKQQAQELSQEYGVQIHLEKMPKQPADYTLVYEYQTKTFQRGLEDLQKVLESFPEGFLWRLCQVSNSRQLHIGLVREMHSVGGDAPADTVGLQYWVDGNAYIALNLGDTLEQAAYHELAHVLDTYVLNNCSDFDVWDRLNPEGFVYHENYTDYLNYDDNTYLEGSKRAFIDAYSMTYAKEDRARVFEYAMLEGCGEYFESEIMQAKLKLLCEGIRDACNLEKDTGTFPWEQYLKESLAYTKEK